MSKADLLQTIPIFRHLTKRERGRIAAEVVEARYKKGQFIFREGDPADNFHILKEGAVKCVKSSPDGKEVTLKVLMPGDLFCCDAAVFEGATHPGCAKPIGDVSVIRISKKFYLNLLRRNPESALEVIKYLGCRLNEAQENAKLLALDHAEQRMASLLVKLAGRAGVQESDGIRLTVRLTRQDLADMAGIAVETATRIMSQFKRARLVSGTAKRLVIQNPQRLQHLALTSCPSSSK